MKTVAQLETELIETMEAFNKAITRCDTAVSIALVRRIIGLRIRKARVSVGLSVTDVADALGMARQWLSQIELGNAGIKTSKREQLFAMLRKHGAKL